MGPVWVPGVWWRMGEATHELQISPGPNRNSQRRRFERPALDADVRKEKKFSTTSVNGPVAGLV